MGYSSDSCIFAGVSCWDWQMDQPEPFYQWTKYVRYIFASGDVSERGLTSGNQSFETLQGEEKYYEGGIIVTDKSYQILKHRMNKDELSRVVRLFHKFENRRSNDTLVKYLHPSFVGVQSANTEELDGNWPGWREHYKWKNAKKRVQEAIKILKKLTSKTTAKKTKEPDPKIKKKSKKVGKDKIMNPKTGRMVKISGKIGQRILKQKN